MINNLFQKQIIVSPFTKIYFKNFNFIVIGPLGSVNLSLPHNIQFKLDNSILLLFSFHQALLLTVYSIFQKKIQGIEVGFFSLLVVTGIGWRVFCESSNLVFKLGYSHLVSYQIPLNLEIFISNKQVIRIFGLNLAFVNQFSSKLCRLCCFDVYKGKGIYRFGKNVQLKVSSKSK